MGGGAVPKIPDWKIYTVGEHTPKLLQTQKMLNSMGLKVINRWQYNIFLLIEIEKYFIKILH